MKRFIVIALVFTMSSACSLDQLYQRPVVSIPELYKAQGSLEGWKPSEPKDSQIQAAWWQLFNDTTLNTLVEQALAANQNLALAEARYRQALALSNANRSQQYPSLTANATSTRAQRSGNALAVGNGKIVDTHNIGLASSWELDVWGRIKRLVETGDASAQASAADVAFARLSLAATVAQNYFQLRILDTQQVLLEQSRVAYERSLQLTKNRYQAGVATKADVNQSESIIRTTQVQQVDIKLQRTQTENAIAVLLGKTPAELNLPIQPYPLTENATFNLSLPSIPAAVPSVLLERRPDIAAAERRVVSANANVGYAKTAFFPTVSLGASAGYQSISLSNLISTPSRVWSIGPLIALSIFDGGLRRSQTDAAIAGYDATVATYRQTVLTGFQEVEDYLSALTLLAEEATLQEDAVRASGSTLQQFNNQYKAGTVDYLSVVIWQTNTLNNQRNAITIQGRRLLASVNLIKALGGGWDSTQFFENNTTSGHQNDTTH